MKVTVRNLVARRIDRDLNILRKNKIVVGVLGNNPDVPTESGLTIRQYGELNEYGTSTIPARPFFRTATKTRKSKRIIDERLEKEIKAVIKGSKKPYQALNAVGLFVKGRIQRSIKAGNWQRNAISTMKRKASTNKKGTITKLKPPLIDTGDLIKSIDYYIKNR